MALILNSNYHLPLQQLFDVIPQFYKNRYLQFGLLNKCFFEYLCKPQNNHRLRFLQLELIALR